ncbi:MAG: hypothetical protein IPJ23_01550 [Ignavibacteriales bacterium]|nr:hypothetical protein [Ignavibacteriales bacterium]
MKLKFFFLLVLSLYIVNCTFYIEAQATIRYVSKTGTSTPPYTSWQTAADSIQKCISICVDGDTIYVANGIYKENLVINTTISLIGSSMDSTVIDGTGLTTITIHIIPSGVGGTIENFKILGKGFNLGAVILTEKSLLIKNCRLLNDQRGISIINNSVTTENILISNVSNGYYSSCISDTCHNCLSNNLIELIVPNSIGFQTGIGGTLNINNNLILYTGTNKFRIWYFHRCTKKSIY